MLLNSRQAKKAVSDVANAQIKFGHSLQVICAGLTSGYARGCKSTKACYVDCLISEGWVRMQDISRQIFVGACPEPDSSQHRSCGDSLKEFVLSKVWVFEASLNACLSDLEASLSKFRDKSFKRVKTQNTDVDNKQVLFSPQSPNPGHWMGAFVSCNYKYIWCPHNTKVQMREDLSYGNPVRSTDSHSGLNWYRWGHWRIQNGEWLGTNLRGIKSKSNAYFLKLIGFRLFIPCLTILS